MEQNKNFLNEKKEDEKFKTMPCCGNKEPIQKVIGNKIFFGAYCHNCSKYYLGKHDATKFFFFAMKHQITRQEYEAIFK